MLPFLCWADREGSQEEKIPANSLCLLFFSCPPLNSGYLFSSILRLLLNQSFMALFAL